MEAINDLEMWFIEKSKGQLDTFGPSVSNRPRPIVDAIEAYQAGQLSTELAYLRAGSEVSPLLQTLGTYLTGCHEMAGFTVYRGLLFPEGRGAGNDFRVGFQVSEAILSSWSLYPSIALRIALAQGHGSVTILRYSLSSEDSSLYIDDWEYEVLRGPYDADISRVHEGQISFLGSQVMVSVVDLLPGENNA